MEMTDGEILRKYQQARDQKQRVKILADLNLCSRAKIIEILLEQGVDPKELPKIRGADKPLREPKKAKPDWPILEQDIEEKLRKLVKRYKGRCLKWVSPGEAGVPDRIVLLPGGRIVFVETKRPKDGKLSPLQNYWGGTLRSLGFEAWVVWNQDDLADFEKKVLKKESIT